MTPPHLGPGHSVAGKYTVRALLGFTSEVATYHAASSDGHEVVIRLYDPAIGQRADVMAQLDRVRGLVARLPADASVVTSDAGYDVGTGAPFGAREHLQTPSLAKLLELGPLSPEVVSNVIRGLARALDAAHALGLYHHALKPTNVFVGAAPHYSVRIADFEACVVRSTSPATHDVYAQAAPWWAPEQLHPAAVLGPAADVFATALVAFFALTGRSYWLACQQSPPDLPAWQLELMGQRVPVSQRARELGAALNPLLDGVFARALSVNQPERPQSVVELANTLAAASSYHAPVVDDAPPKTMAFPHIQAPGAGAAPYVAAQPPSPAPAPAGEFVAAAMPGEPFAPAASPNPGGYVSTGGSSGSYAPTPSDANAAPGLPPFPQPVRRRESSSIMPIVIGVVAAVLIGGGGVAFLFMRDSPEATAPIGSSSASAPAAASDASEAPAPEPGPPPAPSAVAPSPDPTPAPSESAAPNDAPVAVTLRCVPQCERIEIDGKTLARTDEKIELTPGKHKIRLIASGHLIHSEEIEVVAGKPIDKEVKLVKIGRPPPSGRRCGQFLCP
jgi:serine/threonine protein kinase